MEKETKVKIAKYWLYFVAILTIISIISFLVYLVIQGPVVGPPLAMLIVIFLIGGFLFPYLYLDHNEHYLSNRNSSNRNSLKPEFTGSAYNNSHNYWWFSEKEDVYKLFISDYFSCNAKPGPRYQSEGSYSGEWFRKFILDPAFSKAKQDNIRLFVNLDGVVGYSSGFLKECFGELAKAYPKQLSKYLVLECDDKPDLVREIQDMVKDYEPEQKYMPEGISYKVGGPSVAYVDGDILDSGAARRQVRGARELCERSNPNGNGWFSEKRTYTPKKNGKSGEDKKGKSKGKPTGFKPVPDPYERK